MKKILIGIGALLLIGSLVTFGLTRTAHSDNGRELSPSAAQSAVSTLVPVSAHDHPEATNEETVYQTIQTLVTRWSGAFLQGSGWLHVVTHHVRDKDERSLLPNGQTIPPNYISETWYHLNEQGQAIEVIALMRSEDGGLVQISTFRGNVWRNLTVGEKWDGEPFVPQLDLGFSADAARAQIGESRLIQRTVVLKGRTVWQFAIRDERSSSLQVKGYSQPAISAERRAYLDPQSGALLLLERVLVMADGRERIIEQVEPITIEYGVDPPAEVVAFLQQEVTK